MKKIRAILGYSWAILVIPIIFVALMGMDGWANMLMSTGIKVNPWFTGGEVVKEVTQKDYDLKIHRPVFDALIGQKSQGFVQLDIKNKNEKLPHKINLEIDFDNDKKLDFKIDLDTVNDKAKIESRESNIISIDNPVKTDWGYILRVNLKS